MENLEHAQLSEQTRMEMEAGRKAATANAAALAAAEAARAAETAPPPETDEATKAAAEAKPLGAQPAAEREPVFPVAKEPYQPKKPNGK